MFGDVNVVLFFSIVKERLEDQILQHKGTNKSIGRRCTPYTEYRSQSGK